MDEMDFEELLKRLLFEAATSSLRRKGNEEVDEKRKRLSKKVIEKGAKLQVGDRVRVKSAAWFLKHGTPIESTREVVKRLELDAALPKVDKVSSWMYPKEGWNTFPGLCAPLCGQIGRISKRDDSLIKRGIPVQYQIEFENPVAKMGENADEDSPWHFESWMLEKVGEKEKNPPFYGESLKAGQTIRVKTIQELIADEEIFGAKSEDWENEIVEAWSWDKWFSPICLSKKMAEDFGGKVAVVQKWNGTRNGFVIRFLDKTVQEKWEEEERHVDAWMVKEMPNFQVVNGGVLDTDDYRYGDGKREATAEAGGTSSSGEEEGKEKKPFLRLVKGGEDDE